MAKLTRCLGDNIPPEVLLRAASPPLPADSASLYGARNASTTFSAEGVSQSVDSLGNMSSFRRQASMEFLSVRGSGTVSAPASPLISASLDHFAEPKGDLHHAEMDDGKVSDVDSIAEHGEAREDASVVDLQLSAPSAEKQRLLNVKRARKMTQVS